MLERITGWSSHVRFQMGLLTDLSEEDAASNLPPYGLRQLPLKVKLFDGTKCTKSQHSVSLTAWAEKGLLERGFCPGCTFSRRHYLKIRGKTQAKANISNHAFSMSRMCSACLGAKPNVHPPALNSYTELTINQLSSRSGERRISTVHPYRILFHEPAQIPPHCCTDPPWTLRRLHSILL